MTTDDLTPPERDARDREEQHKAQIDTLRRMLDECHRANTRFRAEADEARLEAARLVSERDTWRRRYEDESAELRGQIDALRRLVRERLT